MKIDYLPTEDDNSYTMFAYFDKEKNKVVWAGISNNNSMMNDIMVDSGYAQFLVFRKDKCVIIESCGWYSPEFKFRFEITDTPEKAICLASFAADMMDRLDAESF